MDASDRHAAGGSAGAGASGGGSPDRETTGAGSAGGPGGPKRKGGGRGGGGSTGGRLLIAALVLALGGAAWWFWMGPGAAPDDAGAPADTVAAPDPDSMAAARARADSLRRIERMTDFEVPPLEASDSVIRSRADELSDRPAWEEWLGVDRLARRFVAAVASVAAGASPRQHLDFMAPEGDFAVRDTAAEETVVAGDAFDRYDVAASAFASLDPEMAARLYERLVPLFQEAHAELGLPRDRFEQTLTRAVERLLAVEVPEGPIEVVDDEGVYTFADPELEALSPAEKHLLRLGPENARAVQEQLRELATAIGLEVEG